MYQREKDRNKELASQFEKDFERKREINAIHASQERNYVAGRHLGIDSQSNVTGKQLTEDNMIPAFVDQVGQNDRVGSDLMGEEVYPETKTDMQDRQGGLIKLDQGHE